MTADAATTTGQPLSIGRHPNADRAIDRSKRLRVTGKLHTALDAMVWLGYHRDAAAEFAGLKPSGLATALKKPHVLAWYRAECEVLRTSGRARRLHRLERISEQDGHLIAAVQAIRTLDAYGEAEAIVARSQQVQVPGFVIQIVNVTRGQDVESRIETAKPLIQLEAALPTQGMAHVPQLRETAANPLIEHDPARDGAAARGQATREGEQHD